MIKKHTYIISHIEYSPSREVIMLYISPTGDASQFIYKAGQFCLLEATIGDVSIKRSYSIASSPHEHTHTGILAFSIKRVPGGVFSTRVTTQAKIGDSLLVTGPLGHMHVSHDDNDNDNDNDNKKPSYLLVSVGSGLSPIYSIYKNLIYTNSYTSIALVHGERFQEHMLDSIEKDRLSPEYDRVHTQVYLSQQKKAGYMSGRVQQGISRALVYLKSEGCTDIRCFLCGLPAMVDDVKLLLMQSGIDPDRISYEKY